MLEIISLNVEGVRGNITYLDEISKGDNPKILCLQEHWLWDFEKHTIKQLLPSFDSNIISCDSQNPILNTHVPRGKGGACILWPNSITHCVKQLDISSDRMTSIQITGSENVLFLNVYMPAHSSHSKIEYQECIDIISNFLERFPSSIWVICGDFNATLASTRNNSHDVIFKKFVKTFQLEHTAASQISPTFVQHSGNGSSHIDYILTNKPAFLGPTTIAKYAASNTSAHFSIHSTCKMQIQAKNQKSNGNPVKQSSKTLWQQADTNRYNKIIFDQLQNSDIQGTGTSNSKFLKITETVLKAEKGAVPTKIIRPQKKEQYQQKSFTDQDFVYPQLLYL